MTTYGMADLVRIINVSSIGWLPPPQRMKPDYSLVTTPSRSQSRRIRCAGRGHHRVNARSMVVVCGRDIIGEWGRVRCLGGRISRPPPPSPEHGTRASTTSSVNHRGRFLSKWTHAAACLPPSHDYLVVRICCGDGNPSGKGAKTRRTTNIPHPCRTHSISLLTSMHHAIGDYYLIPRQASDEPAYPLTTGIMVKKRNKDSLAGMNSTGITVLAGMNSLGSPSHHRILSFAQPPYAQHLIIKK